MLEAWEFETSRLLIAKKPLMFIWIYSHSRCDFYRVIVEENTSDSEFAALGLNGLFYIPDEMFICDWLLNMSII